MGRARRLVLTAGGGGRRRAASGGKSAWSALVLRQRRNDRRYLADYPGFPTTARGTAGRRLSRLRRKRGASHGSGEYEAADLAYNALIARPDVDRRRVYVYGRSLGSAAATHTAAAHEVAA